MDKHDLKKIGIGALVGILIALVIVFGIEAFSNKQTEQVATSSEPAVTSSAPEETPDTTSSSEPAISDTQSNDNTTNINNNTSSSSNEQSLYDNDDTYAYVGENATEKWYITKYSCRIYSEDEHSKTIVFELIRDYKNSDVSHSNYCYVRGSDGLKERRYDDLGEWAPLRTDEAALKANTMAMKILGLES